MSLSCCVTYPKDTWLYDQYAGMIIQVREEDTRYRDDLIVLKNPPDLTPKPTFITTEMQLTGRLIKSLNSTGRSWVVLHQDKQTGHLFLRSDDDTMILEPTYFGRYFLVAS